MSTYTGACYAGNHEICRYPEAPFGSCDCECHVEEAAS